MGFIYLFIYFILFFFGGGGGTYIRGKGGGGVVFGWKIAVQECLDVFLRLKKL